MSFSNDGSLSKDSADTDASPTTLFSLSSWGLDALEVDQGAYAPQFYPLPEGLQVENIQNLPSLSTNSDADCCSRRTGSCS